LIDGGLRAGEQVVVEGQYRLQVGSPRETRQIGQALRRRRDALMADFREHFRAIHPPAGGHVAADARRRVDGALGYVLLPISACRRLISPTIQVTAQYPGASPDVMASSVTTPLERQFGQIQRTGDDVVGEFVRQHGHHAHSTSTATSTPRRRTCRPPSTPPTACYPRRCQTRRPTAKSTRPTRDPHAGISSDTLPLEKVNDLADTVLAQKLSEVSGVGLVTIEGKPETPPCACASTPRHRRTRAQHGGHPHCARADNVNAPKGDFDGRHHRTPSA